MAERFVRSEGITPSEIVLANLCDRSFLSLWSYPNLFNDRNKQENGSGQELCDLLVVFDQNIIIFSDKSCAYPQKQDERLNWQRWFRKSIKASASQIFGCERWIKKFPDRIFLDRACTQRLPIALPNDFRIHRVCVALGAPYALSIAPETIGDASPFQIGFTDEDQRFVHVFDEQTLHAVLGELSTIADFVHYLSAKEQVCISQQLLFAPQEVDLLAYYLWHGREIQIPGGGLVLEDGLWNKINSDASFLAAKEENRVSFFWDGLIEYFNEHFLGQTLEVGNELDLQDYEKAVRMMAAENRFRRRLLSKWILDRASNPNAHYLGSLFPPENEIMYVLLIGPGDGGEDHAEYRKYRNSKLGIRCYAAKDVHPNARYVLGIALDKRGIKGTSEDLIFMDTIDWGDEDRNRAAEARNKFNYFKDNMQQKRVTEDEYPGGKVKKNS